MRSRRLVVENYRGKSLPVVLGLVLACVLVLSVVPAFITLDAARERTAGWISLLASLVVFAAGLVDDLSPAGPRGLRGHLRALARGHITTGLVKLVVAVGAALVAVRALPVRAAGDELAGAVLIAASTNLWNGLDVRPGRALKSFLPVGFSVFVIAGPLPQKEIVGSLLAGAIVVLWPDLRERAMLGDSGSNLLGFAAGLWLYVGAPHAGVFALAAIAVSLNVVAETITLSRVIDAIPPLRWVDGLGRPAG